MTSDEIRAARSKLHLTQSQLGEILGLTKRQVQRIEADATPLRPIYEREIRRMLDASDA